MSEREHSSPPGDVAGLRREIEQTRTELGATVEALAAKADVKARLHESAEDAKAQVREKVHELVDRAEAALPKPARDAVERTARTARQNWRPLVAVTGAAVVALVVLRWWNGRRSR
jgi:dsDNA-specific endonuclease/ATPase MutS2